jgi:hypothetical protein
MLSQTVLKRLMLARYLLGSAEAAQKSHREVGAFAAINMLQDAIEVFFLAAAEHLNADIGKRTEFDGYIDKINEKLPDPLAFRKRLSEINKVRVLSKHDGVPPNATELIGYLQTGRDFFDQACPTIFGRPFWTISLIQLLEDNESKTLASEAEQLFEQRDYLACLIACRKIIFLQIEEDYVIEQFAHSEPGENSFGFAICKASAYCKNRQYIDQYVKDPFDYIQLDHDRVDAGLMKEGIDPNVFWNIWRLTPSTYRRYQQPWLVKSEPLKFEDDTAEQSAAYVLENTVDLLLRRQNRSRSFRKMEAPNSFVAGLKMRATKVFEKASGNSKIVGEIPADVPEVRVRFGTPALDGEGYFWRVMYNDGDDEYLVGFVDQEDLILADAPATK